MMYRLYATRLTASCTDAVLCVMAGLVPKTAVMMTQHGGSRAQLEPKLSCLLSSCVAL